MTALLPRPCSVHSETGELTLRADATLAVEGDLDRAARLLRRRLRASTGHEIPTAPTERATIVLREVADLAAEAYRLNVTTHGVELRAGGPAGGLHGVQTLLQLMPAQVYRAAPAVDTDWRLPCLTIQDAPRFRWRGVMLDVARHFMPKHDVLRFIDLAAMHRLNVLHWHLTDDQGWRVEIKRYPRLTEEGAWRPESQLGAPRASGTDGRPHGGFYTQEDIREIVAYAAECGITVVPEIDLPGHSAAAIAAYPHLGLDPQGPATAWTRWGINPDVLNTEETTLGFFCAVLDEVVELFPSAYIGIGGDECPKDRWKADPRTQQLMRERGLKTEEELQAWFMARLTEHLTGRGRRAFGWDELLEGGVPAGTLIASWRGTAGARTAARRGLDVVACPEDRVYLDYRQSDDPQEPIPVGIRTDLERSFGFEPVPPDLSAELAERIIGGQANVWTEHMDSPRTVDYFTFPRLAAVAEVLWSGQGGDFADFTERLTTHLGRLDAAGVEYRRPEGPRPWQRRPRVSGRPQTPAERAAHIDALTAGISDG